MGAVEITDSEKTWAEETGETRHPRILFTSVYGPYAKVEGADVQHTFSMELYNNQVTRGQGVYSPRLFHHSWGMQMIQGNISAPSTLLDFPTQEAFERELTAHSYDIVAITSIVMNVYKVKEMCRIVRNLSPKSKIVVGGHVAAIPWLGQFIDADHIARGDGISWMRRYLGEDMNAPIRHPPLKARIGFRLLGMWLPDLLLSQGATIVPSVGCPMGCKFCATSNFFGGRGKSVIYLKTGEELFRAMCEAESALKANEFFVMDENFLLDRKRAMELLELMKANNKAWAFNVFASANALRKYTMEELVQLGVVQVWIGLESPHSKFVKLEGADTMKLVRDLQSNGIAITGSTIIGLEHHTPENAVEEIEYAVSHGTDFHQFMLYIPFPGTPLYVELEKEGRLLKEADLTGFSGLDRFSFQHATISRDESKRLIDFAFQRDFERNGPSVFRLIRTTFEGWKQHRNHPDERVRRRFQEQTSSLKSYSAALWAMEKMFEDRDKAMSERMRLLRLEMEKEFGFSARMASKLLGPVMLYTTRREEERLARGVTYEPRTFIERKNWS